MKAFEHTRPVALELIELDDIGWDRADTHGDREIVLELSRPDLQAIGDYLYRRTQECIAEESDYFDDEGMRDVPLPTSPSFLVHCPREMERYFRDMFWCRDTILAMMECVDAQRDNKSPTYWIQDFRGLEERGGAVVIKLGVQVGPLYA